MSAVKVIVNSYRPIDGEEYPEVVRETEKAICFKQGEQNYWIPRKSITAQGATPYGWFIEIPFWMAKEKCMELGAPRPYLVY